MNTTGTEIFVLRLEVRIDNVLTNPLTIAKIPSALTSTESQAQQGVVF